MHSELGEELTAEANGVACPRLNRCGLTIALKAVPGHPRLRITSHLLGMFGQGGEIVQGVNMAKLARVNKAHEHLAHRGAVFGLIEEGVLSMEDGFLQRPLAYVMLTAGLCRVGRARR